MPGPRITTFDSRPNRNHPYAKIVWRAAQAVLGAPPSWMRMVPARRYIETSEGRIFCATSRWEIGRTENDEAPIIINGPAREAAEILYKMEI